MYSLILAAALASAPEPAWHGAHSGGCSGGLYLHSGITAYSCCGGWGACYGGSYGVGYGSCYGSSYGGCCGGWSGHHRHGSCYGSCYGNCYGSYSNCYGYGCGSGWGYGTACYGGCYGCYGTSWGGVQQYQIQSPIYYPGMNPTTAPAPPAPGTVVPVDPKKVQESTVVPSNTTARLLIETPAESKLFVDGQSVDNGAGRRLFSTPALQVGQSYYYDVRVETVRDGKPASETRRVVVRAGDMVREQFAGEITAVSAK